MKTLDRKIMMNLVDMIAGEINRMCVTKELSELDSMALHAKNNIEKLQAMRYADLRPVYADTESIKSIGGGDNE